MFPKEIQIRKVYFFKLNFSYFQKACAKICRFRKSTLCDVKKGIVTSPPKLAATVTVWFQEANTEVLQEATNRRLNLLVSAGLQNIYVFAIYKCL